MLQFFEDHRSHYAIRFGVKKREIGIVKKSEPPFSMDLPTACDWCDLALPTFASHINTQSNESQMFAITYLPDLSCIGYLLQSLVKTSSYRPSFSEQCNRLAILNSFSSTAKLFFIRFVTDSMYCHCY